MMAGYDDFKTCFLNKKKYENTMSVTCLVSYKQTLDYKYYKSLETNKRKQNKQKCLHCSFKQTPIIIVSQSVIEKQGNVLHWKIQSFIRTKFEKLELQHRNSEHHKSQSQRRCLVFYFQFTYIIEFSDGSKKILRGKPLLTPPGLWASNEVQQFNYSVIR